MGENWQAGDLALCVSVRFFRCAGGVMHSGILAKQVGLIAPVSAIRPSRMRDGRPAGCGCVALDFADGRSGVSQRFVKVTPPAADEFDRETIALLNGQPVGEPA